MKKHYDPDVISGALCMGPYDTPSQDRMNDHIGDVRRNGWDAVLTNWPS